MCFKIFSDGIMLQIFARTIKKLDFVVSETLVNSCMTAVITSLVGSLNVNKNKELMVKMMKI